MCEIPLGDAMSMVRRSRALRLYLLAISSLLILLREDSIVPLALYSVQSISTLRFTGVRERPRDSS